MAKSEQETATRPDQARKTETPQPSTPTANPDSAIRKVDFDNFTYPYGEFASRGSRKFTLHDGEFCAESSNRELILKTMCPSLGSVGYGDVTGDGEEEALIYMAFISGGSAMPGQIYIYGLNKGKTKLLWAFATGDRADGGFRRLYSDSGGLVVELNSLDERKCDGCQPTLYTRTRYKWDGRKFLVVKAELLPVGK
ncbi:MAG TPA: hypothetical protein VFD58_36300 [Blastocatellia bacterium]|nr:hypothetical protein [Blastocatellia bacterium]